MKKGIFITVRSDSSRLPNKAHKEICGSTVLEMIIKRAKLAKKPDIVIVCTTEREVDNNIVEIAKKQGVQYFKGSLNDKLARWLGAARNFKLDCFATFDGDDLLCAPELIDLGLVQLEKDGVDFLEAPQNLAVGAFTYCIKVSALKKVCEIKNSEDTEMMWTYFKDTGLFKTGILNVEDEIYLNPNVRLTLDYPEDFDFFKAIFKHFNNVNNTVELKDVMKYLTEYPEVIKINEFRAKEWRQNQSDKMKLILKK